MALVLQLATLLLATTAFATPSPECTPNLTPDIGPYPVNYPQSYVYLAAGLQTFACNASGVYESASFSFQLYDASCLPSTSNLDAATAFVQDYMKGSSDASVFDWNTYIKQSIDLDPAGQLLYTNDDKIEIVISQDKLNGGGQTTVDLKVTSQGDGWEQLTGFRGGGFQVLMVESNSPRPTSSCGSGSPSVTSGVAVELFVYTSSNAG